MINLPTFFDIDSCLSYVEKSLKTVSKTDVKNEMEKKLDNEIQDRVYSRRASVFRTGSFGESVDSSYTESNMGIDLFVFNNPEKMSYSHPSLGEWNGISAGSSMNEYIGNFLNDGHKGIFNYRETGFYEATHEDILSLTLKTLKSSLGRYGLTLR